MYIDGGFLKKVKNYENSKTIVIGILKMKVTFRNTEYMRVRMSIKEWGPKLEELLYVIGWFLV